VQNTRKLYVLREASPLTAKIKILLVEPTGPPFPTYENPLDRYESFLAELLSHSDTWKRRSVVGPHPDIEKPLCSPSKLREYVTLGPEGNCTRVLGLFYAEGSR
jgi:hypothetical protein